MLGTLLILCIAGFKEIKNQLVPYGKSVFIRAFLKPIVLHQVYELRIRCLSRKFEHEMNFKDLLDIVLLDSRVNLLIY